MVDSADIDRFPDAKAALEKLLNMDQFSNVPILILGNKIDIPWAVSEEELRLSLGLEETTGMVRHCIGCLG